MHNSSGLQMMQLNGTKFSAFGKFNDNFILKGAKYPVNITLFPMCVLWKAEANKQTLGKYVKCMSRKWMYWQVQQSKLFGSEILIEKT